MMGSMQPSDADRVLPGTDFTASHAEVLLPTLLKIYSLRDCQALILIKHK